MHNKRIYFLQAFSALTIGAPIPATQTPLNKEDASSFYSISRKKRYV
jgi:hypothetical protein